MRRKDREITNRTELTCILKHECMARLALLDIEWPYTIPLNYALVEDGNDLYLYFHGTSEGKKLELIRRQNPHAAFEAESHSVPLPPTSGFACNWSMSYESVCGNGLIELLDTEDAHIAMDKFMHAYGLEQPEYGPTIAKTTLYRLHVQHISSKHRNN